MKHQLQQKLLLKYSPCYSDVCTDGVGLRLVADKLTSVFFGSKFFTCSRKSAVISSLSLFERVWPFLSNPC
jgi:hypothetical protein